MGRSDRTQVLIAGGGATGTIQALLLAQHGIESIVVEARDLPYESPRAHAVNPRSLEICRSLGLDVARMQRQAAPRAEGGLVHFVPRLFGPVFGSLPYERQDDGALEFTPTPLINLPQTEFEAMLFEAATAQPLITYRRGYRWVGADVENDGVISTVGGPDGEYRVNSDYVIGCDGAGSAVRESLGIGMSGDEAVLSCLSIIFRADLRAKLADRPGMLFWATDPAASGTFLGYHMDRLWSFVEMHPPGPIDLGLYPPERCREIVLNAAGGDIAGLEILEVTRWTMTSQVADSYGGERIFLAGDSAHRFPPTGGLGLNTGIQDAHNLAWKIKVVNSGRASAALLASYETERRPVALRNAAQSLLNAQRLQALAELQCEEDVWRDPAAFKYWLETDNRAGRIAAAVALQTEHFDSFDLQLGFSYPPAAPDGRPAGDYRPCGDVGHRMPHAWFDSKNGGSALDLLDPLRFTLLVNADASQAEPDPLVTIVDLRGVALPAQWMHDVGLNIHEAILVRPDGHVAWRGNVAQSKHALETLLQAINELVEAV